MTDEREAAFESYMTATLTLFEASMRLAHVARENGLPVEELREGGSRRSNAVLDLAWNLLDPTWQTAF